MQPDRDVLANEEAAAEEFRSAWSAMTEAERRDALRELADRGLPTGVSISIEGAGKVDTPRG